jgi:hypothetical protein
MRVLVAAASMLLVALSATACGTDSGDTAQDPGSSAPPMPTAIPPADGPVVGLGLVLDASSGGEPGFCLGPVAESYPPQCTGLPMTGWSWAEHRGDFDNAGGVRFGSFAITGTFDGETLTYRSAVSGALYDPMPTPEPTSGAGEQHSEAELETIAQDLRELPGALSTMPGDNLVVVDVVHDDGSIQDWADQTYGEGLVFVHSALQPA